MTETTKANPIPPVPEAPKLNVFGRPREYDPAYHLTQTRLYLDGGVKELELYSTNESKWIKVKLPQIAGLAVFMKVGRNTIYEWMKVYPDFRDTMEQLMAEQEEMLIEYGLNNRFNSTITKLLLGTHGYKDKTDVTTNDKDITPENKAAADVAIDKFLTKKPDGDTTNTSVEKQGKDIAPVQVQPAGK